MKMIYISYKIDGHSDDESLYVNPQHIVSMEYMSKDTGMTHEGQDVRFIKIKLTDGRIIENVHYFWDNFDYQYFKNGQLQEFRIGKDGKKVH